jgi:hypothetical protein
MALTREQLLDKLGAAYQAVGQLTHGHDDPQYWPTEAEQIRLLDYLSDENAYDPDWTWPHETEGLPRKTA